MSRIFTASFSSVYPHYVTKVEKKGRTKAEDPQGLTVRVAETDDEGPTGPPGRDFRPQARS